MKIASTFPFKAALAAASIVTVGVIALNLLDTEVTDYGVEAPHELSGCRLLINEHPAPPLSVDVDLAEPAAPQPLPVIST